MYYLLYVGEFVTQIKPNNKNLNKNNYNTANIFNAILFCNQILVHVTFISRYILDYAEHTATNENQHFLTTKSIAYIPNTHFISLVPKQVDSKFSHLVPSIFKFCFLCVWAINRCPNTRNSTLHFFPSVPSSLYLPLSCFKC